LLILIGLEVYDAPSLTLMPLLLLQVVQWFHPGAICLIDSKARDKVSRIRL